MKILSQTQNNCGILKFEIEKILGTEAQEFQDALLNCLEKDIKTIIVDLSKVKFVSSWGIGMLVHGLATTKNRGSEFKLAGLSDNVLKVIKTIRLDSAIEIYNSVDAAIAGK